MIMLKTEYNFSVILLAFAWWILLQLQIVTSHKTTKSRKGIRHLFKMILLFKENPSQKSLAFPKISLVRRGL